MSEHPHRKLADRPDQPLVRDDAGAMELMKMARPTSSPPPQSGPRPGGGSPVPACAAFEARTAPSAVLSFRRALEMRKLPVAAGDPIEHQAGPELACVAIDGADGLRVSIGLDFLFEQTWDYREVLISDLQTTIALAPLEEVRLEVRATQRKVLEQSTLDSVEQLSSTESVVVDKDIVNVARSSARTSNWRVDGSASFSIGPLSIGGGGGTANAVTETASGSVEKIHESTRRSANTLKTLHKVEIRGLTESTIDERIVRVLKNPYVDRTLTISVLQLLKRYHVTTRLTALRPTLVMKVDGLVFDRDFVLRNGGFLQDQLLDHDLARELAEALAAMRHLPSADTAEARRIATSALAFLFDVPNVFNLADTPGNDPAAAFDAQADPNFGRTGLGDSLSQPAAVAVLFTALNFNYKRYKTLSTPDREREAVGLAVALAEGLRAPWTALEGLGDPLKAVLDTSSFTEPFRRVAGFLLLVDGLLKPLVAAVEADHAAEAASRRGEFVVQRVVEHLHCQRGYYIQCFLRYVNEKSSHVAIEEFVRQVLAALLVDPALRAMIERECDPARTFVDRNELVVPSSVVIDYDVLVKALGELAGPPRPTTQEATVDVPFDGVHFEIAPGKCVLSGVPAPGCTASAEVAIKGICVAGPPSGPGPAGCDGGSAGS